MMRLIQRLIAFIKRLFKRNTMRRKISLYIADQLVDLDDQSFILFNYTMEDMTNPAIVRNSFSQSISLKGTPNNNKIFGGIWRSDRETTGGGTSGAYFDPTRKTTFTIYNELNEVLESGYCKLDSISRKRSRVEYKVSLYGGLGAFFYALSYDEEGNKRTLADLKFRGQDAPETELDFQITKDSVLRAWKKLNGDVSQSLLWDIINFAPAYNGFPSGLFDASKAMIHAETAGLSVPEGYSTTDGFVLATLPMEYTEWETKDLRSYLQRPVIKMSKVIEAICQSYNNGGYEVDLDDDFFSADNPYFNDTYLTLPIINTLQVGVDEQTENITPHVDGRTIYIPNGGDIASVYDIKLSFAPKAMLTKQATGNLYMSYDYAQGSANADYRWNFIGYKVSVYDRDGVLLIEQTKYVGSRPFYVTETHAVDILGYFNSNGLWQGDDVQFVLSVRGAYSIVIEQDIFGYASGYNEAQPFLLWYNQEAQNGGGGVNVDGYTNTFVAADNTSTYIASETARTGAIITKKSLLSSEKTPADYLLSFCKMFGLVFKYDKGLKKISILQKRKFYQDNVIDLTDRIDVGEDIQINPFVFDSKWYNFGVKYENGEYASYYSNLYDRIFGLQRVNTGYGFNADSKDVMDSVLFRGAVEVLERSKYFVDIVQDGKPIPSVFQDSGGTYSLNKNGEIEEFNLPTPSSFAAKKWLNDESKSYDLFSKAQFHDRDNESYEDRDTLLFFRGMQDLTGITDRYAVTDDNAWMMALNDNTPCWLLDYQLVDPSCRVDFLPMFSRYKWRMNIITKSLDFGTPAEVDIPDVTFHVDSSIYNQYWSRYITDRYDNDSKVMKCKVNLSGMQVDESLFQSFYFFDGALWALNKIINHSLTTWDETECEFVKVQDKSNYLN